MPPPIIDPDGARYRRMATRYAERTKLSPTKRCFVAIMIAIEEFELTLEELQAQNRKKPIAEIRQQIMAFANVVSGGSTYEIGRILKRAHTTVMHAVEKYGAQITSALGGKNERRK